MTFRPLAALALAAISLAYAISPAIAGSIEPNGRTAFVKHADLDLTTQAGKERLQHRLRYAVQSVCANGSADLAGRAEARACADTTTERTMPEVNRLVAAAESGKAQYAMIHRGR